MYIMTWSKLQKGHPFSLILVMLDVGESDYDMVLSKGF